MASGCLAWVAVDDKEVALLDGITAAAYTPPFLICSSSVLPFSFQQRLRETKVCTLSVATTREPIEAYEKAGNSREHDDSETPSSFAYADLGLSPSSDSRDGYPRGLASSPIHMYCSLYEFVDLGLSKIDDDADTLQSSSDQMLILIVDTFVIDGSVLSPPTEEMRKRPNVTAKIDAELIQPLVSMGRGRYVPMSQLMSMPRPAYNAEAKSWKSPALVPCKPSLGAQTSIKSAEWSYRIHGSTSPLGYNPTTALIMPLHSVPETSDLSILRRTRSLQMSLEDRSRW
jgi:hypothetical protein